MNSVTTDISAESRALLAAMQQNEATECIIYTRLASCIPSKQNANVLARIGEEEGAHAAVWQQYTGIEAKPKRFRIFIYLLLAKLFGFTFAMKLMENGEEGAQGKYQTLFAEIPEAQQICADEARHESELLALLDEERLHYVGSMVLGLNDALVELTGTLAGLTFALQNNRLVALSGLITGISATLSMASSEYLSARSEGRPDALKSCVYTGIAYVITVILLILPYLLLPANAFALSLGIMLITVVCIILVFNFYIAVAQDLSFQKRFCEMAAISLGVAALSFLVGLLVKQFLGITL
ncbi:MAG: VIT1/CCC1 transporter family protein [Pygmaiobacter sp.]